MMSLNLCTLLLLSCLARESLQGAVKPQGNGRGSPYFATLIRGVGGVQPGAGLGPAGAKAGKYLGYGGQGLPTGLGVQNGFGAGPSFGGRPGYGVPGGYGPGLGAAYPQVGKQKPGYRGVGYPRVGLPLGGLGARGKPSKTGYGAGPSAYPGAGVQQAYPGAVGPRGYPSNGLQNGYGNGYGAGGNGFPGGYGNGVQAPYGSQLGGPAGDPTAAKYGGAGQLTYNGQPQQPEATGLGGDYGNGRYGAPQSPYGAQAGGPDGISVDPAAVNYGDPSQLPYGVQPASLDAEGKPGSYDNGNGAGYMNGGDSQTNGLAAGAYGPLAAGQAPGAYGTALGPGQPLGGYGGKESKYGMNGFLGNGYRGRCPSGKC